MNNDFSIILTRRCPHNCYFCYLEREDISIQKDVAFKALEFFINSQGIEKNIKLFGGEPLLEWSLLKEIVKFGRRLSLGKRKRINFILSTTLFFLNKEILNFIQEQDIELNVSSLHLKTFSEGKMKKLFSMPFFTLVLNILPSSVKDAFRQFMYFFQLGARRFNILPLYYSKWDLKELDILKEELGRIREFYRWHPEVYLKNIDNYGDIPLFNTSFTCDVNGDVFISNMIIFRGIRKYKKELWLGNVKDANFQFPSSLNYKDRLRYILRKTFPKEILRDTFKVDGMFSKFVASLKRDVKRADLKVGYSCNNHCKFCVQGRKREFLRDKTTEEIKEILREARRTCNSVVFTGGEPTIRRDVLDIVSYARRLGFERIQIQTNGRMLAYKKLCRELIEAGANEFNVALHGHIPQLHDFLTSSSGSFYQTVKAIKNLKELGQKVYANTVITKSNYIHLPEIAFLLVQLGVDQFQFAFVHPLGFAEENFASIVPRMTIVIPYVKKGLDIGKRWGIKGMTEGIPYCFMHGYYEYIGERVMPSTQIFEFREEVVNFDELRCTLAKCKGPQCKLCKFYSICEGPWREYPEKFGWDEFIPIIDEN